MSEAILETEGLGRAFKVKGGALHALSDVTLSCPAGRSIGIVGESGCGKTTLNRLLLLLDRPTSGTVRFKGRDLATLDTAGLRAYRTAVQPVFQNPYSSLNPRMKVRRIIAEPLKAAGRMSRAEIDARVAEVLEQVGLSVKVADRLPSEFSGGQRQRIAIARALVKRPELYIFDDSFSSLDTATDARLRQALRQHTAGATLVIIAQRVSSIVDADQILVLDDGRIVAHGTHEQLLETSETYQEIVNSQLAAEEAA